MKSMKHGMKKNTRIIALVLLTTMLFAACGKEEAALEKVASEIEAPEIAWEDNYRTYYEVFVYSYYDSNGDGIGDINGVTEKLDYIEDMGFSGIWLMPIMPSPSYHKYDTTDYMAIDPTYGTMEDFEKLIEECHNRNIKVIIDLAMNHTSSEHPWFKEAYAYVQGLEEGEEPDLSECPYVDYYNFSKEKKPGYSEVADGKSEWYYEAQFYYGMPDLNWENDAVFKEYEDIATFWLEKGVDGFRLDAVKYYALGDDERNVEILSWFSDYVKSINENAYLVCEDWSDQNHYAKYYESGVDSMFDFAFADKEGAIAKVVKGNIPASAYGEALVNEQELYANYNADYINAPFYTNHDLARSAGYYAGDWSEAQTKLAQALNLLMSGNVFLYYGEELGMKGSGEDENKRAPMYWSLDASAPGMCDGPAGCDAKMKYDPYEKQSEDATSIYQFVKDVIAVRNANPCIAHGIVTVEEAYTTDALCVIRKTYDEEEVMIVYNLSQEAQAVTFADDTSLNEKSIVKADIAGNLTTGSDAITFENGCATLPAYSVLVLK